MTRLRNVKHRNDAWTARQFAAIPGSRLLHLSHNKHELTWILVTPALA